MPLAASLTVPTGDALLGRVLNGLGEPIDGGPPLGHLPRRRLGQEAPDALHRRRAAEHHEVPVGAVVVAPDGTIIGTLGREGDGPGEVRTPQGIVLMPDGTVGIPIHRAESLAGPQPLRNRLP